MNDIHFIFLDTSTTTGSICLFKNETVVGEKISNFQKSHSEFFNQALSDLLFAEGIGLKDLKFIATSSGPGSFTGIRVGLSLVKTLSYLYNIPIVAFNSLEVIALTYLNSKKNSINRDENIFVMTNAFKNMVYFSKFKFNSDGMKTEIDCQVVSVDELKNLLIGPGVILGDAFEFYSEISAFSQTVGLIIENFKFPMASQLGAQSLVRFLNDESKVWNHVLPLYLKASEAEENLRKGMLKVGRRI